MLTSVKETLVDYDFNQGLNWLMDSLETDWAAGPTYTVDDRIVEETDNAIEDIADLGLEPIPKLRNYARRALEKDLKKAKSKLC